MCSGGSGNVDDLRLVLKGAVPCGVLFSGGFDSEVLLRFVCQELSKGDVIPFTAVSPLLAGYYGNRARRVTDELGLHPVFVDLDVLNSEDFCRNDALRCYICKKSMYGAVKRRGKEMGCNGVVDGTTKDDLGEYRPGLRAASEEGILHPFVIAQMGNSEVELLGKRFGLSKSDIPSDSCLATRISGSNRITRRLLKQVEEMESALRSGVSGRLRVRLERDSFVVEYTEADRDLVMNNLGDLERKADIFGRELRLHGPA